MPELNKGLAVIMSSPDVIIIFPLLSLMRGSYFNKISNLANYGLVIAGLILFIFQLNNFFSDNHHSHNKETIEHLHHH